MGLRTALCLVVIVAGCARPPAALRGDYSPVTVSQALARPGGHQTVRWGGALVRTTPEEGDRTCFEVVERPLDRAARPRFTDESSGRFVACASGFFDPAVWAPGRDVTAVGRVDGTTTAKVGDADYRFPVVDAEHVHLWPERDPYGRTRPAIGIGIGGFGSGVGGGIGLGF